VIGSGDVRRRTWLATAGTALAGIGTLGLIHWSHSDEDVEPPDPFRPAYHFAPTEGWMNDPNGLVYHDGRYHLFYQAGAERRRWDHATSTDLVDWTEHGTKLPVEGGVQQFSGGGVVDGANTAGFGEDALVVTYTGHHETDERQDQRLAYSTDGGETLTKYDDNPVLPSDQGFRDPNVFRYGDGWRMVVSRVSATEDRPAGIEIYSSENLREWMYESTYERTAASGAGTWECPDLYELPVEGTDRTRWVLSVSADYGREEHHIGHFDGTTFEVDRRRRADHGPDFYAGMTWSNEPQGRRLLLGWLNRWEYAPDLPDPGWQGVQSFPRRVTLSETPDGIELRQRPAAELRDQRQRRLGRWSDDVIGDGEDPLSDIRGRALELSLTLDPGDASAVSLHVRQSDEQRTTLRYDTTQKLLVVDRSESGRFFDGGSASLASTSVPDTNGMLDLHVLVDRCSVETFVAGGRRVLSTLIYPDWSSTGVSLTATDGTARLVEGVAHNLGGGGDRTRST